MNSTLASIVDKHLKRWLDIGLNKLPRPIEPEMSDPTQDIKGQWRKWVPIKSQVTLKEIENFEKLIGHTFPKSYKDFLRHKHFYSLHISNVSFFSHPIRTWKNELLSQMTDGHKRQFLLDKGYLPFAEYTDWGLLCFDMNNSLSDEEYEVVMWDHEQPTEFKHLYSTFEEMLIAIDNEQKNIS